MGGIKEYEHAFQDSKAQIGSWSDGGPPSRDGGPSSLYGFGANWKSALWNVSKDWKFVFCIFPRIGNRDCRLSAFLRRGGESTGWTAGSCPKRKRDAAGDGFGEQRYERDDVLHDGWHGA